MAKLKDYYPPDYDERSLMSPTKKESALDSLFQLIFVLNIYRESATMEEIFSHTLSKY